MAFYDFCVCAMHNLISLTPLGDVLLMDLCISDVPGGFMEINENLNLSFMHFTPDCFVGIDVNFNNDANSYVLSWEQHHEQYSIALAVTRSRPVNSVGPYRLGLPK